jgi:cytochrome b561
MNRVVYSDSKRGKFIPLVGAVAVIAMLAIGFFIDDLPKPYIHNVIQIHKSVGISLLLIMIVRAFWVAYQGKPPLPSTTPAYQRVIVRIAQKLMYVFVIAMALVGIAMTFAAGKPLYYLGVFPLQNPGVPINNELANTLFHYHELIAYLLMFLIFLHVTGALKHHFYDKDDVLKRML